jgi:hypothetical protein
VIERGKFFRGLHDAQWIAANACAALTHGDLDVALADELNLSPAAPFEQRSDPNGVASFCKLDREVTVQVRARFEVGKGDVEKEDVQESRPPVACRTLPPKVWRWRTRRKKPGASSRSGHSV